MTESVAPMPRVRCACAPTSRIAGALALALTALSCSDSSAPPVDPAPTVAFVFMGPPVATLTKGTTLQLVGTAVDASFNPVSGAAISWVSSNQPAVSVSSSGLLTAVAPGTAVIGATSNGVSGYATVAVPVPAGPNGPGIPPFTMAISARADYGITVVRSDGTVESRVSCGTQCSYLAGPNWSRDGSKLALTGRRDTESVLFVVNRDGTDLHEVASAPPLFISPPTNSAYWSEFREDWSSDGRLVYVRSTSAGNAIETVAADGTGRTTVMAATDPNRTLADLYTRTNPRWGLGDSMITAEIGGQIYGMNPDGSNLRQLTSGTASAYEHRWSPDGKTIAYSVGSTDPSHSIISILDPISGASRQITVPRLRAFCWSPSSSQLSLVSLENEVQGWESIYTVNADGTGLQKAVTAIFGTENSASAWSPDGSFLIYMDDRRWTGGPPGGQVYAQSVGEGTNTKLTDIRNVIFLSIAETRGCGRYFQYP